VLVDPKGSEYTRYRWRHAADAEPPEFRDVAGRWATTGPEGRARALREALDLDAAHRDPQREGMSLFTAREGGTSPPWRARSTT